MYRNNSGKKCLISVDTMEKRMKQKYAPCLLTVTLILLLSVHIPHSTATYPTPLDTLDVRLNYTDISSFITSFGQINCGPLPNQNIPEGSVLTQQYKDTGFQLVRTHDLSGPTDISMIFPDPSLDPNDPSSYNFTLTDTYITSIIESGCNVFYRLGESASGNQSLRQPPKDFEKWAEICKHILMHYNDGWNNGFHYNITYVEIWNEPDLLFFWNGTAEQYYELYKTTAETLRSYDPDLRIGGPCTSSLDNQAFTSGFLTFVKDHDLPFDFYSWHRYADSPYHLYNGSIYVRMLLDSYGFTEVENINTEYNINLIYPQRDNDNAKNAAFTTAALSVFQDAGIDKAFRYRGTQDNNWLMRFIGLDISLFTVDGTYKTPALSYLLHHTLLEETPLRLSTEPIIGESGITILAGISADASNISIVISNYEADTTSISFSFDSLPWNQPYSFVKYCIDDSHHLQIIDRQLQHPENTSFIVSIPPSTVYHLRLTNASTIPCEGPMVASIPWFLRLPLFDPLAKILSIAILLFILG